MLPRPFHKNRVSHGKRMLVPSCNDKVKILDLKAQLLLCNDKSEFDDLIQMVLGLEYYYPSPRIRRHVVDRLVTIDTLVHSHGELRFQKLFGFKPLEVKMLSVLLPDSLKSPRFSIGKEGQCWFFSVE